MGQCTGDDAISIGFTVNDLARGAERLGESHEVRVQKRGAMGLGLLRHTF